MKKKLHKSASYSNKSQKDVPFIKIRWIAFTALIFFLIGMSMAVTQISLLLRAVHTTGTVTSISAANSECHGSGTKFDRYHDCTKFYINVRFKDLNNEIRNDTLYAGSSRGFNQPVSNAINKPNQILDIIYDPDNPNYVLRDDLLDVFTVPIITLVFAFMLFAASVFNWEAYYRKQDK